MSIQFSKTFGFKKQNAEQKVVRSNVYPTGFVDAQKDFTDRANSWKKRSSMLR